MPEQFPREDEVFMEFIHSGPGASGDVVCTLGAKTDSGLAITQARSDAIADAWGDGPVSQMCSQIRYDRMHMLVGLSSSVAEFTSFDGRNGALTGNQMVPLDTAIVVKKLTGLAGRRFRGRLYLPGIPEGAVDDAGILLSSYVTSLASAFSLLLTRFAAFTIPAMQIALLHRPITKPAVPEYTLESIEATEVTAFAVESQIGTQRTRIRD